MTSGPTSPNSLTSGISSGNEKVRLPHLDRSSCLELTISSFDIAYIVIFLMALHRRPEFNADLASGSADDHIALSIVHLLSRKLRLMLIVVLQPINYCMAFIFPFPKIAMRHNRCSQDNDKILRKHRTAVNKFFKPWKCRVRGNHKVVCRKVSRYCKS